MIYIEEFLERLNFKIEQVIPMYLQIYWNKVSNMDEVNIFNDFYNKQIRRVLYNQYIKNINIDKKDISVIYNCIIKDLNLEIDKNLRGIDINEYIAILYGIACFQGEFHNRVFLSLNKDCNNFINIGITEEKILKFISQNRDKRFRIDSINATHKIAIQYLIEKSINFSSCSNNQKEINMDIIYYTYMLSLIITNLIEEKNMLLSGLYDDVKVWIEDYMLYNNIDNLHDSESIYKEYIEDLESNIEDYDPKIVSKLSSNFFKSYGFKIETILKILEKINKTIQDKELVNIVEEEVLIEALSKDSGESKEEIKSLIEYLTINKSTNYNKLMSMENYINRIFEKAFVHIEYGDRSIYMFSYMILTCAYQVLRRKLIYNLLPDCEKANSRIIEKEIKNNLVNKCGDILKSYTDKIILNAEKIYIDNKRSIILSNEIDIIAIVGKILFIIECKDIYYKFTPYGFKSDANKTYSFINKMKKKYTSVVENKESFEEKFECEIEEIKSIIVFKTYNMTIKSKLNSENIEIINFNMFDNLIKKYIKINNE